MPSARAAVEIDVSATLSVTRDAPATRASAASRGTSVGKNLRAPVSQRDGRPSHVPRGRMIRR